MVRPSQDAGGLGAMARSLSVQMLEKTHLMFGLPSKKCMNEHLCMCACAYMKSNLVDRMGGGPRDAPGALQQLDSSRASFSGSGTGGPAARAHIFLASQLPSGQRATLFKNSKGNSLTGYLDHMSSGPVGACFPHKSVETRSYD